MAGQGVVGGRQFGRVRPQRRDQVGRGAGRRHLVDHFRRELVAGIGRLIGRHSLVGIACQVLNTSRKLLTRAECGNLVQYRLTLLRRILVRLHTSALAGVEQIQQRRQAAGITLTEGDGSGGHLVGGRPARTCCASGQSVVPQQDE
ncbi:hypothetical protein F0L68_10080 [Solihabitans fulvus]|uniref:Uncharacterized protein n=1 Tax=Solihabitans fulvus TaxID=1892852 RepID=A0A5B2XJJ3_9PSEU|nr:hypothetical protein [Solihabitans fulvus]KAA2263374.1 hypothetical protein F0L68_10080 [Solihabitans fulvus]